jgi:signal transduction histidine kinase
MQQGMGIHAARQPLLVTARTGGSVAPLGLLVLLDASPPLVLRVGAVALAVAGFVALIRWQLRDQERSSQLSAARRDASEAAERHRSASELFVNLVRRSQRLVDRQVSLLVELEARETDAELLGDLFRLDHLATRIRRSAESLLVLAGDEPPRRWGEPVPLAEVCRAAASEVEEYQRVEVAIEADQLVAGHAFADVTHLLAELIENGTTFSPPGQQVEVTARGGTGGVWVVRIEDRGLGMSASDLTAANRTLAEPPEVDLKRSSMLGLHVVARLAQRHGITVELGPTPGGGVTASVTLPGQLITRPAPAPERRAAAAPARRPRAVADHGLRISAATPALVEAPAPTPPKVRPSLAEVAPAVLPPAPAVPPPAPAVPIPAAAAPTPAPAVPPGLGAVASAGPASAPPSRTANGLPRRIRGTHLAPPVAGREPPGPPTAPASPPAGSDGDRAEATRSLLTGFQAGQAAALEDLSASATSLDPPDVAALGSLGDDRW